MRNVSASFVDKSETQGSCECDSRRKGHVVRGTGWKCLSFMHMEQAGSAVILQNGREGQLSCFAG